MIPLPDRGHTEDWRMYKKEKICQVRVWGSLGTTLIRIVLFK